MKNSTKMDFINRLLNNKIEFQYYDVTKNLDNPIQKASHLLSDKTVSEEAIYVASERGVSVIDVKTNTVKAIINTGGSASDVAVTPDGKFLYVTPFEHFDVSVIDIKTGTVVDTINLTGDSLFGTISYGIAITLDGKFAYVTHGNKVLVINVATNMIITIININEDTSGIAITPNGKLAYIAGTNNVFVLDIQRNVVVKKINLVASEMVLVRIVITPDGKFAYAANFDSGKIFIIDVIANTVKATINIESGTADIAITLDGKFAYTVGGNSLSIIDITTNVVIKTLKLGENLMGVAISRDGEFAYINDFNNSDLYVINTASNTIITTVTVGSGAFGICVT
ncbi:YncE family protein [Priestia megaterium]|uniref:YncE family protein n=1 Tax=Priestia megaterium TaxID=1404 RepID=UPI002E208C50|nr:YncE family protein [Priestia megaterium]